MVIKTERKIRNQLLFYRTRIAESQAMINQLEAELATAKYEKPDNTTYKSPEPSSIKQYEKSKPKGVNNKDFHIVTDFKKEFGLK